jgi:hypothetical protein
VPQHPPIIDTPSLIKAPPLLKKYQQYLVNRHSLELLMDDLKNFK